MIHQLLFTVFVFWASLAHAAPAGDPDHDPKRSFNSETTPKWSPGVTVPEDPACTVDEKEHVKNCSVDIGLTIQHFYARTNKSSGEAQIAKLKKSLDCYESTLCLETRRMKYFTEGAIFVLESVYGPSYECFHSFDIEYIRRCVEISLTDATRIGKNPFQMVFGCAANHLNNDLCSSEDKATFIEANTVSQMMLVNFHMSQFNPSFNLTFDPNSFENFW